MTPGPGVALNEEKSPRSTSATTPVSIEGKAFTVFLVPKLYGLNTSARSLMRKMRTRLKKIKNAYEI